MVPESRKELPPGGGPRGQVRNTITAPAEWPRPAREIREELSAIAVAAYEAGTGVDPAVLEPLARELHACCGLILIYGGDPDATQRLADAVEETAEVARILAARKREAA